MRILQTSFNSKLVTSLSLVLLFILQSCNNNESSSSSTQTVGKKKEYDKELVAMVLKGDKYGYINPYGEFVIDPQYALARSFSDGLANVNIGGKRTNFGVTGGSYKFIDIEKNVQLNGYESQFALSFYEGVARVKLGEHNMGFIDKEGKLIAQGFSILADFHEGLALAVADDNITAGFIDLKGEFKIKFPITASYSHYSSFKDGLSRFKRFSKEDSKFLFGYMDKEGLEAIPAVYEEAYDFSEGYAVVMQNDKFGFINKKGELVVDYTYKDVGDFSDGLVSATMGDEKWGYINMKGEWAIPDTYQSVAAFSQGYAPVYENGKVGFIDKKGEWFLKPEFDNAYGYKNGFAIIQKDGKLGFIDLDGDIAIKPIYTRVDYFVNPNESNAVIKID